MKTVAVDFDGVIHGYSRGWQDGSIYDEPVPGAFAALRVLMEKYAVFIFTARDAVPVVMWLCSHGFTCATDPGTLESWNEKNVLLVTNRKLPAAAYVDDLAIRFTSWGQALSDLEQYA